MQWGFFCVYGIKFDLGFTFIFACTVVSSWWHCFTEVSSKHKKMENANMIPVSVVEMRVSWTTDPHAVFFLQLRFGVVLVLAFSFLGTDPGNNMYHPDMWT